MKFLRGCKRVLSALKNGGFNSVTVTKIDYNQCLYNKKILITGGSSGIGYAIAKKCIECGARVVITGRNEEKLLEAVGKLGERAQFYVFDQAVCEKTEMALYNINSMMEGNIDCLVNCAGVQPVDFFPNVSEEEWDRVYNINSKGVFFITQSMCKLWMTEGNQRIHKVINISSQGGFVGATYPYRMTKWDIRGLTQGLGIKMAPYGILVNAIAPGIVKTEMQHFAIEQGENTFCSQNPLERVCLPEEIAELALFMLSDACNFMVGQTILVDGGYSIK